MDLATIENHCHFIKSDGCLIKIYYHSILNLKSKRSVVAILKFAFFDVLQIPTNQVMIRSVLSKFNWLSIIQTSTVQQRPSFSASFLWSNYTKILKLQAPPNHRLNLKLRGAAALTKRLCPGGLNCTNWAPTLVGIGPSDGGCRARAAAENPPLPTLGLAGCPPPSSRVELGVLPEEVIVFCFLLIDS